MCFFKRVFENLRAIFTVELRAFGNTKGFDRYKLKLPGVVCSTDIAYTHLF